MRHGLAKALTYFEPDLRPALKKEGFLTRDSPRRRAQEVRPPQGARELPVLEALIGFFRRNRKGRWKQRPFLCLEFRRAACRRRLPISLS